MTARKAAGDEALLYEQETILLYNQAEDTADVYTHDPKLLKKLARLAEKYPDQVRRKDAHSFIVPKRCVSVREPYSEQRRRRRGNGPKRAVICRPDGIWTPKPNKAAPRFRRFPTCLRRGFLWNLHPKKSKEGA